MLDAPYKDILVSLETGDVSLFRNKNYDVSVPIGMTSPLVRPIICVFDTGVGPDLIEADLLNPSWIEYIRQRDMPDVCSESDNKL